MILYIDATGKYVAKQDEAKKAGRGWHQVEVPTTDGRQALADYLNALRWSEAKVSAAEPRLMDREEIVNSNTPEAQVAAKVLMDPDHKPAFTQAQVDAMFAGKTDDPLPSVDDVCRSIAEMRGAAIGHVAHELAARVETLAKEVAR